MKLYQRRSEGIKRGIRYIVYLIAIALPWLYLFEIPIVIVPISFINRSLSQMFESPDIINLPLPPMDASGPIYTDILVNKVWKWSLADISLGLIVFSMCISLIVLSFILHSRSVGFQEIKSNKLSIKYTTRIYRVKWFILYVIISFLPTMIYGILRTFSDSINIGDTKEMYILLLILLIMGQFLKQDLKSIKYNRLNKGKILVYYLTTVNVVRLATFLVMYLMLFIYGLTDFI